MPALRHSARPLIAVAMIAAALIAIPAVGGADSPSGLCMPCLADTTAVLPTPKCAWCTKDATTKVVDSYRCDEHSEEY